MTLELKLDRKFSELVAAMVDIFPERHRAVLGGPSSTRDPDLQNMLGRFFSKNSALANAHKDYASFCYRYSHVACYRKWKDMLDGPDDLSFEILPMDPREYHSSRIDESESWHSGMWYFGRALHSTGVFSFSDAWGVEVPVCRQLCFFLNCNNDEPPGVYCEVHPDDAPEDFEPPVEYFCESFTQWMELYAETEGNLANAV